MVMAPLPLAAKAGQYAAAGLSRLMRPRSTSSITAVVVATTLVREARSKMVSTFMGKARGSRARFPKALRYTVLPRWPTRMTAPGMCPAATSSLAAWSMLAKRRASISPTSGSGGGGGGGSTMIARQRRRRRGAPGQTAQNKGRDENETSREGPDGRHLGHGLLL